jgi:acetate kinase
VQVGVFDTAFHQTMPASAFLYALPYHMYTDLGIRRYGMHGTSYRYLVSKTAQALGKPGSEVNAVIAHLGEFPSKLPVQACC